MRRGLVRQAVAWLAVLCVQMQLAAVAACAAGTLTDAARFPICHAPQGAGHTDDHAPPTPDHPCPFCAAHCHATAISAPAHREAVSIGTASAPGERPVSSARATPPDVSGVSPRGPPVAA